MERDPEGKNDSKVRKKRDTQIEKRWITKIGGVKIRTLTKGGKGCGVWRQEEEKRGKKESESEIKRKFRYYKEFDAIIIMLST